MKPWSFTTRSRKWFASIRVRTQLLLVVNTVVGVTTLGMLYLDYRASMDAAILSKQASLADEASAIGEAINALSHHGSEAVQAYLDGVCTAMDTKTSPGHTVQAWQATGQYFASHTAHVHSESLSRIRGESASEPTLVRVSESVSPVVTSARATALRRALVLFVTSVVAAAIVNALLLRLISAPLEALSHRVRTFGERHTTVDLPEPTNAELATLTGELGTMMLDLVRREEDRAAQLARARRLQSRLMAGASSDPDIAIEYHPADQVAGDYVEVIELVGGDRLICLADVVGHGVPAAMGAAVIKALVISLDVSELSPAAVLKGLNSGVYRASLPEDFVTMIVVRMPALGGPLTYASAGHETCYVLSAQGGLTELSSTGMILGIDPSANFEDVELDLDAGDVLVLMSDGLSESADRDGKLLGRQSIVQILTRLRNPTAKSVAESVLSSARQHLEGRAAADDMTVVTVAVAVANQPQGIC